MLKTKPTTSTKRTMSTQATTKRPAGLTRTERDLLASLAENQEKILAELAAIRAVMTALTKLADLVTDLAPTARGSIGKKPRSLIPNAATVRAMEAARRGELSGPFNSVEELLADLHADD